MAYKIWADIWSDIWGDIWELEGASWGRHRRDYYERLARQQRNERPRKEEETTKAVRRTIKKAVAKAIDTATAERYYSLNEYALAKGEDALRAILAAELDKKQKAHDEYYFTLYMLQIMRIIDRQEEEAIIFILMEL